MELAFTIALGPWTLAQSTPARSGFATNTLPVWAKEPRLDVAFHNAQISTVHGVILYPILNGVARCGCLGPRAMGRHQSPYDPPKLLLFKNKGMHVLLACAYTQKNFFLPF